MPPLSSCSALTLSMAILDFKSAVIGIFFSFILYQCTIIIQRLYFSPLAKFPGPKLSAATYLVEFYYDILKGEGGQLLFEYRKWHKQYGPIIRVNPDELHVQDSSWYETLYAPSRPVRKLPSWGYRFNAADSTVGTIDPALHRLRRGSINPFFSKRNVMELGPKVQNVCNRIMSRLETEYQGTPRVLSLSHVWECLAADIVTSTTFGFDLGFVESPQFNSSTTRAIEALVETTKMFTHFSILPIMVDYLPEAIMSALSLQIKRMIRLRGVCYTLVLLHLAHN